MLVIQWISMVVYYFWVYFRRYLWCILPSGHLYVWIFQNAKRASTAAAPLAAWVKANVQYSHVLERIQPLETEQSGLQA